MVRFCIYLKIQTIRFPDGLVIISGRKERVKNDPIFFVLTKFELPMAEAWKISR